jgi:hypothetical protein
MFGRRGRCTVERVLHRRALHATLRVPALLAVLLLPATEVAAGVGTTDPARYRYAGVVENGRSAPTHYIATGDGIGFYFFDAFSQGRQAESYRVCVGHPGKSPVRCWTRTATYGLGRLKFPATLPSDVPLGPLVARWFLGGRTVAAWTFLYARGG